MWFRNTIRRRAKKTLKHIWLMSTKNFVHICRCYKKLRTFHEFASKFICFKINIIEHEWLFNSTLFSKGMNQFNPIKFRDSYSFCKFSLVSGGVTSCLRPRFPNFASILTIQNAISHMLRILIPVNRPRFPPVIKR